MPSPSWYRDPGNIGKGNEMRVCPPLMEKYPVFWWSQTGSREWAFRRIEPFLDLAYAEVVEFRCSGVVHRLMLMLPPRDAPTAANCFHPK